MSFYPTNLSRLSLETFATLTDNFFFLNKKNHSLKFSSILIGHLIIFKSKDYTIRCQDLKLVFCIFWDTILERMIEVNIKLQNLNADIEYFCRCCKILYPKQLALFESFGTKESNFLVRQNSVQ